MYPYHHHHVPSSSSHKDVEAAALDGKHDPTLSACCIQDLENRAKAEKLKAKLNELDPVRRRLEAGSMVVSPSNTYSSTLTEAESAVQQGGFVVVLKVGGQDPSLEAACQAGLEEWRQNRPRRRRWFQLPVAMGGDEAPSISVWNHTTNVATLDKAKLMREPWHRVAAMLSTIERHTMNDSDDVSDDDETGQFGAQERSQCDKPGCDRTFHHVHIKPTRRKHDDNEDDE